jgi:hypothetical protein
VYTCRHSGKQRVVLLAHETCRCGNEHEKATSCAGEEQDGCGNKGHQYDTEARCCDVAYRALEVDQENHSATSLFKGFTTCFTLLFVPSTTAELPHVAPAVALNHSPPPCTSNTLPSIYRLSQLRV